MKRIISLSLILVIIVCSFSFATSGDSGYQDGYNEGYNEGYSDGVNSVSKPKEPNVVLVTQEKIPEVSAGGNLSLVIEYKNDSQYTAKSIKISPIFEGTPLVYERPMVFESNKNLRSNGKNTASFSFKVKDDAKIGVYGIKFKIEYKNSSDENYSREGVAYFRVNKEKVKSIVTISNITTEPANVVAGERFVLKFNVNNIGDVEMNSTSLKLTGLSTDTFMPVDGNDLAYIGKISPKSFVTQSFNMIASSKLPKGSNNLGATITYSNTNNEEVTDEKTIYIFDILSEKESGDDSTNGKPKIIIQSYHTSPLDIVAGNAFSFVFTFKNTSREKSIKNMKITINSEDGAFMIANGSNTFYIENLAAQASATKSIDLNVKQDLTSKSYPINISFDYEDSSNNSYQATEIINIPVIEYSNLVINSVFANEGMVNQQTSLSFDYINMGKAKVSNLTASVEGDYTAVQSINYIGNLEAGSSDYYDISVIPTKEGENVGVLVLTFEDSSGKKINVKKDFTGFAMGAFVDPGIDDPGTMEPGMEGPVEPVKEPVNVWYAIGMGFGSFLVAFIITKIITTKIVRKKLEDEI